MPSFTLRDVQDQTYKSRDSWWTVWLVDPLASRLVRFTANRTSITPNQLTLAALFLGLLAALCFLRADWYWLLAGAVLFHLSFVLDCMDGKIARLKGTGSVFGSWLDYVFDRIRVLVCGIALLGGQFALTGNPIFLWVLLLTVFTDMFRYLNSPQMAQVRTAMRRQLTQTIREIEERAEGGDTGDVRRMAARFGVDTTGTEDSGDKDSGPTREVGNGQRSSWYRRFRDALKGSRIRSHLFSGIEFQMGVFIVAPLVGMFSVTGMVVTIVASAAMMLAFELLLIYKLWSSTREFARVSQEIDKVLRTLDTSGEQGLRAA